MPQKGIRAEPQGASWSRMRKRFIVGNGDNFRADDSLNIDGLPKTSWQQSSGLKTQSEVGGLRSP
jgi:hypothetical protein